jgi:hypothetical protein
MKTIPENVEGREVPPFHFHSPATGETRVRFPVVVLANASNDTQISIYLSNRLFFKSQIQRVPRTLSYIGRVVVSAENEIVGRHYFRFRANIRRGG